MSTAAARVLITPESYPNAAVLFDQGSEIAKPVPGTGIGKWDEVSRGRKRAVNRFTGESLMKINVWVVLDAFPDGDLIDLYGRVFGWAARNSLPYQPTVLRTQGPIPFSNLRWILTEIDQLRTLFRDDGVICFVEFKLELTEYNETGLLGETAPAPSAAVAAQERASQISNIPSVNKIAIAKGTQAAQPRTYVVKQGDTLSRIAANQLGNANRYKEIAALNGIRDPNRITVGQVLKLPS